MLNSLSKKQLSKLTSIQVKLMEQCYSKWEINLLLEMKKGANYFPIKSKKLDNNEEVLHKFDNGVTNIISELIRVLLVLLY